MELKRMYASDGEVVDKPFEPGFVYSVDDVDAVISEKDAEIATLKKEVSRQKRLRCYNLKMWCSAERFTNRGRTIPEEGRWWERHLNSVCRIWEKFKEAK